MGLGIAKAKPKYTPPKVCKKATTVLLPTWNFVACPNVPYLHVTLYWPQELVGLSELTITHWRLERLDVDHCSWALENQNLKGNNAGCEVTFFPAGPQLAVAMGYTTPALDTLTYIANFTDYDSRKPKLLLPSRIPFDGFTSARADAGMEITI